MAITVVGLFEQLSEAQAAQQELLQNGFTANDIDLRAPYAAEERGSDMPGLRSELRGHGVPEQETNLYVQGVKSGDALEIAFASDERANIALEIMNRNGALDIYDAHAVRQGGVTNEMAAGTAVGAAGMGLAAGSAASMTTSSTAKAPTSLSTSQTSLKADEEVVLPIIQEEIQLGKRQIQRGGVRVFSRMVETPVEESISLHEEHVTIERHAVNRPADANAINAAREGVIEVRETAEVPVVAKEARVVEEVVVGKQATDHMETVHDTVRRTDVQVEEVDTQTLTHDRRS